MTAEEIKFPIGSKVRIVKVPAYATTKAQSALLLGYVYRVVDNEYGVYILSCPVDVTFLKSILRLFN